MSDRLNYESENHCYSGNRDDAIHHGNSKNINFTINVIMIGSIIFNITFFIIVVIMVICGLRCYVLYDFCYLTCCYMLLLS